MFKRLTLYIIFFLAPISFGLEMSWTEAERRGISVDEYLDTQGIDAPNFRTNIPEMESISRNANLNSGFVLTTFGTGDDAARVAIIQNNGTIVLAGRTMNISGNDDFAVIKYHPDGSLDTSFNTSGKLQFEFGSRGEVAHAMTAQTDGRLVLVGVTDDNNVSRGEFAIARVLTNGTLDTSFMTTGKVIQSFGTCNEIARAVSIDTSGRILAGGLARTTAGGDWYHYGLMRFLSNGAIDTSFATTGKLVTTWGATDSGILGIAIDSTGRVLAGGSVFNAGNWDISTIRYNTNGTLDTSFNTTGKLRTAIGTSDDNTYALLLDTAGRTLSIGASHNGSNFDFSLIRISSNGVLDTSFKTTGKATTAMGSGDDIGYGAGLQTDGKILIAGKANTGNFDFAIARFNTNGVLDTSFKTSGSAINALGSGEDSPQVFTMLGDDTLIVAGRSHNGTNLDFAFTRYNTDGTLAPSGSLDKSWGSNGFVITDILLTDGIRSMTVDTSGRLIAGGFSNTIAGADITVIRYNLNGSLDTSFNTTGKFVTDPAGARNIVYNVNLQTNGSIVISGDGGDHFLAGRITSSGNLDTSFNTTGTNRFKTAGTDDEGEGGALDTFERLVMGGQTNNIDMAIARLTTDGVLDTTFNSTGYNSLDSVVLGTSGNDVIRAIAIQSDSKIMASGTASNFSAAVLRYLTNGIIDTSFNTTGIKTASFNNALTNIPYDAIITGSDQTIISARANGSAALAKYRTDGSFDTSFSINGSLRTQIGTTGHHGKDVRLAANGKIIVATFASDSNGVQQFTVLRHLSDGTLDTTFSTVGYLLQSIGTTSAAAYGIAIQSNGKILVGGESNNGTNDDFAIIRVWP